MSFEWSTPARSAGQQSLDPIPVEIYLRIFDYLESDPSLKRNDLFTVLLNLTPVCRLFCSIAFARIFSSICIIYEALNTDKWAKRGSALLRAIQAKKPWALAMAHIPVSVTLSGFYIEGSDWGRAGLFKLFTSPLRKMENLRSLTLNYVKMDLRCTQIMCSLNLTSLALRDCVFAEEVYTELLDTDIASKLEKLTDLSINMRAYSVSRFIAVMQVILDLSHLKTLALAGHKDVIKMMLRKLIDLPDHSKLERLEVSYLENGEQLLEFLTEFPLLEHLIIEGCPKPSQEDCSKIREQNLVHLQCPQHIVQLFQPLHQLRSLDIRAAGSTDERIPFTQFRCLADSWSRIRKLRLPFYIYAENPIAEMCSSLLHLQLENGGYSTENEVGNETLQTKIARFKPAPSVLTFTISGIVRADKGGSTEKLLQLLEIAFPRIEEFRLSQGLQNGCFTPPHEQGHVLHE